MSAPTGPPWQREADIFAIHQQSSSLDQDSVLPPTCITSQAWPNSAVVVMEEEEQWGKEEGRRNIAWKRSNKSQPQSK